MKLCLSFKSLMILLVTALISAFVGTNRAKFFCMLDSYLILQKHSHDERLTH